MGPKAEADKMTKDIKEYLQGHYDESKKLDKASISHFMARKAVWWSV